ncbi:site-2 protease family protein [Cocleimonas sp. KMM 6892]|uniref:site-2 protease family protein n=1 Tax=unclassified Cocleimonas TaxID=2639732 RepID=UPI002DBC296D|nr:MULTISPECIES: site-2 protease family protein [unclassified Cocleimonas]MEB8433007.1 site-2 protease family protein [Cocleimonas sp. KMM 6892]MEC4716012.1 site-2 protease family protein [Cocleimonas sp. KMM 6895]MEC4745473.1 site-2 protease family protein [Cocleimonas sp. KMM 6896]
MNIDSIIYNIAVWSLPVLFAITLHEVAHGWMASKLGDNTAKMLGRLTVNPFKHIDPIGTVVVPLAMVLLQTGFVFGWAKPVPVNMRNLNSPRKDMAIVAAAGPISNLLMAVFWVFIFKLGASVITDPNISEGVKAMGQAGIIINLILFIFNLLPIPPLDGSKVLSGIVPPPVSAMMDKIEPYGLFIVIGLLYFGVLNAIISPVLTFFLQTIGSLFF